MEMFLKFLRAAREVLALPPFSADAESAYCDAIASVDGAAALAALRAWMRRADRFPLPHEIREVASQMARAKEATHG